MTIKKMVEDANKWLEKHSVMSSLFGVIATTILAFLLSLIPSYMSYMEANRSNEVAKDSYEIAEKALSYTKKEFAIQYTPDLRSYIPWEIKIGPFGGRSDNIIIIPISICNKSYGLAKDIKLSFLYNVGTGDHKPLEQEIPVLNGGDESEPITFRPSLNPDSLHLYASAKQTFKMKIFLSWKDASGKGYNSVEEFYLTLVTQGTDVPQYFAFSSKGFYSTVDNPKEYETHSKGKIDF